MNKEFVNTTNEGKLEVIQPFTFIRGIDNKDRSMGIAKKENGDLFKIYPDACYFLENGNPARCYCAARAVKV